MPIRKFRSIEDMPDESWHEPGSAELLDAIARTWAFAARACPRRFPPGVHRHRSIEEAERLRERWELANFRAHWERLGSDGHDGAA